jgi:hypothetical protein
MFQAQPGGHGRRTEFLTGNAMLGAVHALATDAHDDMLS